MLSILRTTLDNLVKVGNLTIVDAGGSAHSLGDGTGTPVTLYLLDRRIEWQLLLNPYLYLGEAYMDRRIRLEQGRIYDLLETLLSNIEQKPPPPLMRLVYSLRYTMRLFHQINLKGRARRNVAHHYDLDRTLYDLFLDEDHQYSCAYFEDAEASLEEAQIAKKRHLASKLYLQDGQRVLDIGSGWGGLGLYLASCADVRVTGITLSEEQLRVSRERKVRSGLDRQVDFRLEDYRTLTGTFDRIVSVGMFEHVGVVHYPTYFQQIRNLLTDDGVAVIHTIGRSGGPGVTNAWIEKYIFPGGYIPALSEVLPVIERSGLVLTDVEVLRLHYADTLRHWRERFLSNRSEAAKIYDDRFCRMWEFYLAASETAFRYEGMVVFQLQMAKNQHALPLTRDYMIGWERSRRQGDARQATGRRMAGE